MNPTPQKAAPPKDKRYWLRLLTVFLVACVFALIFLTTFLGASFTWGLLYGPCGTSTRTPADANLPFEPVELYLLFHQNIGISTDAIQFIP